MADPVTAFLNDHLTELIIAGGVGFGFFILWKKIRTIPNTPDFVKIFHEQHLKDESLNVIDKLAPKWLYRGNKKLGRIITENTNTWSYTPTKEEVETKAGKEGFQADITTITFREKDFMGTYIFGSKKILHYIPSIDKPKADGNKLIFHSDTGFTAMGQHYMTKKSFKQTSIIIESDWSKRLLEANVTVMASKMSHISAETPEMAHELSLKRLEIEKIRAEKQSKVGGLI